MNAEPPPEPQKTAASEPEVGAMPEKRAGARSPGGSTVSAGTESHRIA